MTTRKFLAAMKDPEWVSETTKLIEITDGFCEKAKSYGWSTSVEDATDEDGDYQQLTLAKTFPVGQINITLCFCKPEDLKNRLQFRANQFDVDDFVVRTYSGWHESEMKGKPILEIYPVVQEIKNELLSLVDLVG